MTKSAINTIAITLVLAFSISSVEAKPNLVQRVRASMAQRRAFKKLLKQQPALKTYYRNALRAEKRKPGARVSDRIQLGLISAFSGAAATASSLLVPMAVDFLNRPDNGYASLTIGRTVFFLGAVTLTGVAGFISAGSAYGALTFNSEARTAARALTLKKASSMGLQVER